MKKRTSGFIPAYKVQYQFMVNVLAALREQQIDALIDEYEKSGKNPETRVYCVQKIRAIREHKSIIQGTIDRFVIKYRNGMYWIKNDPRVVLDKHDPYQERPLYLGVFPVLRADIVRYYECSEFDICFTIKIPVGMSMSEVENLLRDYNESRTSHSMYDCSGAEVGRATIRKQQKKGELRILDCIRYDFWLMYSKKFKIVLAILNRYDTITTSKQRRILNSPVGRFGAIMQ